MCVIHYLDILNFYLHISIYVDTSVNRFLMFLNLFSLICLTYYSDLSKVLNFFNICFTRLIDSFLGVNVLVVFLNFGLNLIIFSILSFY